MNIGHYQAKRYGAQPCWELVADVYANERRAIAVDYLPAHRSVRQMADAFRVALHACQHGFTRTDNPGDFAVVLMGRNAHVGIHHCGIYYAGRVLHAEPGATLYEELSALRCRYPLMEFWSHAD